MSLLLCRSEAELQKAFNLSASKIFKVCKPSTKYCKVGLSILKVRMNLANESLFFFTKKASIFCNGSSSINFFVMLVLRIDYVVCWHENFLTDCPFCKPSSRVIPAYPWLFCNSVLRQLKNHFPVDTIRYRPFVQPVVMSSVKSWS